MLTRKIPRTGEAVPVIGGALNRCDIFGPISGRMGQRCLAQNRACSAFQSNRERAEIPGQSTSEKRDVIISPALTAMPSKPWLRSLTLV
jgi:hypothetical protein